MATLYHVHTGQLLTSVHGPDYIAGYDKTLSRQGDWLINPHLPECASAYWRVADDGLSLVEMTAEEKAAVDAAMAAEAQERYWQAIRLRRNTLLTACDWTQLPDAPLTEADQQAWLTYRQTLRDLPQAFVMPVDVVWPEQPE